jgi:hypothetical protein
MNLILLNERLLQFIWQFQYFNKGDLVTTNGEALQIIFPGHYNTNQGPDFLDAKVLIEKTTWAGAVELHIKTSDWKKHGHDADSNYSNVVLHVVWENDAAKNDTGVVIPILELKDRISKLLLQRYQELLTAETFIPCHGNIHTVREITWRGWKERLLAERLLRKASLVNEFLQQNNYHWEETFWWILARNFGVKVNADAFEAIARSIPLTVLAKQKHQIHQLEAILLGQAGLLNESFTEDYPIMLQKEYKFQQRKNSLQPINIPIHFLRMRPGNFPTIRLAQLAMLIHTSAHLFSKIKEATSVKEVKEWFTVTANDYWHYHYQFDELAAFKKKAIGASMIDSIIINTIVPVLFAYGNYHEEVKFKEKALQWLEETMAESNSITKGFIQAGIENKNAYDSQALIELKNQYCSKKRCLECGVGNAILKSQ